MLSLLAIIKRSFLLFLKISNNNWLFLFGLLIQGATVCCFIMIKDRNQTGLHRFKPSSCTFLKNEQFYLLNQLQLKVKVSRHRGNKHQFC